jgi:hypothetical protein
MTNQSAPLADRLLAAQLAIDAVLANSSLQTVLNSYGYDAAAMTAAKALYENAEKLTALQRKEYGEQHAATQAVEQAWATAKAAYSRSLGLARIAFKKDPLAQTTLALGGSRKQSLTGWLKQAEQFYRNLLDTPVLLAGMAKFGYDEAAVQAEYALVKTVREMNMDQEREKGEAQKATQTRDEALDELDEWLSDFRAVSRIAFAGDAQKLEGMGFGPV